jgi:hypothetical protein
MIEYENLNNLNKPLFEEYKTAFNEVFREKLVNYILE